jgi:hypothetical protein
MTIHLSNLEHFSVNYTQSDLEYDQIPESIPITQNANNFDEHSQHDPETKTW